MTSISSAGRGRRSSSIRRSSSRASSAIPIRRRRSRTAVGSDSALAELDLALLAADEAADVGVVAEQDEKRQEQRDFRLLEFAREVPGVDRREAGADQR